ncbi:hypothetical protein [Paenibacillus sp. VCA1]
MRFCNRRRHQRKLNKLTPVK